MYTKNVENDNSGQCHSGSINTGTNHRVLFPVGGNGAIPGGADNNSNESPQMSLRAKRHDRTVRPVVCRLWTKPQTCDFHDFSSFVAVGSFTADGGLLLPTGSVKTTPHKTIFAV